jgi:GNAT superfamily N-acetyltransferase
MQIRKADITDIPTIQSIAALTWPHAYADVLTTKQVSYMLNLMYNTAVLTKQMTEEGQYFLLAIVHDKPIGFAGFSAYEQNTWKLHKLYVLPLQQQSGVGKKLLHEAECIAKEQGATSLILNVNRNNKAKDFYSHLGYAIHAVGDFDIGQGFFMNDYIMKKVLD